MKKSLSEKEDYFFISQRSKSKSSKEIIVLHIVHINYMDSFEGTHRNEEATQILNKVC